VERRRAKRTKRRATCELWIAGERQTGILLDISSTGLFIQTTTQVAVGSEIDVEIKIPGDTRECRVRTVVARVRRVPPSMAALAAGGLGLRILDAPASYWDFVGAPAPATVGRSAGDRVDLGARPAAPLAAEAPRVAPASPPPSAPPPAPAEPPKPSHRVRVKQVGGLRTRVLDVSASSPVEARKNALVQVGQGWEVVEVAAL
jgi:hypothetical protein